MALGAVTAAPRPAAEVTGLRPPPGAPPAPGAPPRRLRLDRATAVRAGRWLTAAGLLAALFLAHELLLSGLSHDRAQAALLATFKRGVTTTTLGTPGSTPDEGGPVALLQIPRIGLEQLVVEGTSPEDLKADPGHLRVSPLPGEFGNSVIAGRRTTYGGPLRRLDELRQGDPIRVTTGQGSFLYIVSDSRTVPPGRADPLIGTLDSRLTLVTSTPAYMPTDRLVVVAKLRGAPAAIPHHPPVPISPADLGLAGDAGGLGPALVWGQLLTAMIWGASRMRRSWPVPVVWLLAAPVILGLAVLTFSSLDRILPGTL